MGLPQQVSNSSSTPGIELWVPDPGYHLYVYQCPPLWADFLAPPNSHIHLAHHYNLESDYLYLHEYHY